MKTFKQILQEKIEFNPIDYILDEKLVISPKMIEDVFGSLKNQHAYHLTGLSGLLKLEKLQKKRKTISVSTEYTKKKEKERKLSNMLKLDGITLYNHGIIVELKGDIAFGANRDVFSSIDNTGRRWINNNYIPPKIQTVIKKYVEKIKQNPDYIYDPLASLGIDAESQFEISMIPSKDKAKIIKDYYDLVKKTLIQYKDEVFDLLFSKEEVRALYNEHLMYNFTIQKIHVLDETFMLSIPEDIKKKYNVVFTEVSDFIRMMK